MTRGQLPKVYLRIDPGIDSHPDWPAMVLLILWANRQEPRGYFKSDELPRKLLGAKRFAAALKRRDLTRKRGGVLHLEGWELWQEGDLTVGERVRRFREKRAGRNSAVTTPLQPRTQTLGVRRKALGVGRKALGMESSKKNPGGAGAASSNSGDSAPLAAGVGGGEWIDHDHGNDLEARLVARCEELAAMVAGQDDGRTATDEDRLDVLRAVTSTQKGKSIKQLRGAPRAWVEESLRACEAFAADYEPAPPAEEIE